MFLVSFDPDNPDSGIEGWCHLSGTVVARQQLKEIDLVVTLTHSLKGRAVTLLAGSLGAVWMAYKWENF